MICLPWRCLWSTSRKFFGNFHHREHFGRTERKHGTLLNSLISRPVVDMLPKPGRRLEVVWTMQHPYSWFQRLNRRRLWKEQWCQGGGSVKRKCFPAEAWAGGTWKFVLCCVRKMDSRWGRERWMYQTRKCWTRVMWRMWQGNQSWGSLSEAGIVSGSE